MSAAPDVERFLAEAEPARSDVPAQVREYLAAARAHLEHLQDGGASGRALNEAHSDLMDRLVRRLFELAEEAYFAGGGEEHAGLCVVAVGGYARREMSLLSDVDLLFLYRDRIGPHVSAVAERLQTWLWDAQLAVGAATRTIAETVKLARRDSTVRTGILAPRFLAGSGVLFQEFQDALRAQLASEPIRFIQEQVEGRDERHARFGDSLYLLQPNLKDGAGGLRDYHLAYWVMQVASPGAGGREAFLHQGLLTEDEIGELEAALDFLWRVRNELHRIAGRKTDQLGFDLQEQIARALGYGDDEGPELPVERFMSAYYRHARAIQNYSSLVVEQCRQRLARPRRRKVKPVERGLRVADGQLEIPHPRMLREDPRLLLLAFAVAQDHDVGLTRKAQRLIREHLDLIDDDYRRDPEAQAIFLRILESEQRVARTLMVMNEVGLLATYVPEWEHIVCRWQHVMYHTYTVDVHSIFLVEELRRLWLGRYDELAPELARLMRNHDDRAVLFLGCLLHDIGKGFGGDHSEKGVRRAWPCVERLGLSAERQERVIFLVRQHLWMSHLAQRRDLSDPRLILEFARTVGDRVNLRNLYLLSFADMRASSAKAWTEWKGTLLHELFERTSELLETGAADPGRAIELIEQRIETRRTAAAEELARQGMAPEAVEAYFEMMPRRYFTAHPPRQIARHAMVVVGYDPEVTPVAVGIREMRGGFTELIVCARDVHGWFANVAGTLTAHNINILGAHVYTTHNGLALEVYRVSTPAGGEKERALAWEAFERSLLEVVTGAVTVPDLLRRRGRVVGATARPSRMPPSVTVTNEESDFYTLVDVAADDRLGLLHDLTRVIAEHGFEIYISKAAKITDQVTDTFYLKDRDGRKVENPVEIDSLREDLRKVLTRDGESLAG